jgi:uncharacterized membrane protein YqiK
MQSDKIMRRHRFKQADGRPVEFVGKLLAQAIDDVRVSATREISLYRATQSLLILVVTQYDAELPKERVSRVTKLKKLRDEDLAAAVSAVKPGFVRRQLQEALNLPFAYPTNDMINRALRPG